MRIECPQCAAEYEVPESRVGSGRTLRCSRCGNQWRVEAPQANPAASAAPASPRQAPGEQASGSGAPDRDQPGLGNVDPDTAAQSQPEHGELNPDKAHRGRSEQGHPGRERVGAETTSGITAPLPPLTARQVSPGFGDDRLAMRPAPATPRNRKLVAAWIATVLIIVAAACACFVWRADIVRVWPASARILGAAAPNEPSLPA